MHGRSGSWVDRIGLMCAPLAGDGTLGPAYQTVAAGGDGGIASSVLCPAGQVLVGLHIWSDSVIYRIDLLCQTVEGWNTGSMESNAVPGIGTVQSGAYTVKCPAGAAIRRIDCGAADYVYSVNPECHTP
jgi:hypothetical protein